MSKSLYKTLEVSENATPQEIKKSYRSLAKKYHPDINKSPQAEEKFKEINGAYEVLGDKDKKSQYDMQGDSMFGGQNFHDFSRSQGAGVDMNDIINQMFGQRRGGGSPFGNPFGQQEEDLDINANFTIDFETSITGGVKNISINNESFDIKIPEGVKNEQKIRIKNKGEQGHSGRGDLIIQLYVDESSIYSREDDELTQIFDVPLYQAFFGGKIKIKTLQKEITLTVPQNTKQNQKFRVKNLGVLNRKTKEYGVLYLKVNIVLPSIDDMSDKLIDTLKEELPQELKS